ncbi:universal stress protein [Agrobacterium sp. ES01]|uniref:universal stress protein n=1 Tax=Agrobacterium sp. ES01 TaxID=3420714 RepID=UPI003D0EE2C7
MGYKTILSVLDNPKNAAQVTEFSIALAEQFGAHVVGLHSEAIAAIPLVAPMEIPDPSTVQALQEMAQEETQTIEKIFSERAKRNGTAYEWRSFVASAGLSSSSLIQSARTADLVVAAQGENGSPTDNRADLENFLFESGRPMLLIPYVLKQPKPIRKVMVAWNGSREATRATYDALPFLKAADSVEVYCVSPGDKGGTERFVPGAAIATTLARHGVNVTVETEEGDDMKASVAIQNRLADSGIDLLIMGAYTHQRWWEMLFGGVTRTLLDSMTAMTLLSR